METLVAEAPGGDAEPLRARVEEVLSIALAARSPWPSLDEWPHILPAWFVDECNDDVTIVNCVLDKWSLRAWIYWFQPEQRRWTLKALRVEGDRLYIDIEPTGQGSLLVGTIDWLVKVAGGRLVSRPPG